jgi:predicted dehydrogenase
LSFSAGAPPQGAPNRRWEIALAGCGRWGARILRDLAAAGAGAWVVDPSEDSRRRAEDEGAAGTFRDAADLPRVDAAVVATPTRLHAVTVERLARLNVPIFCEKPLTADGSEATALAERFGDRLYVLDKWRYHPAVEALARMAAEETFGPVRALRTRRVQPSISGYDVDPVWILAPHELSIAAEILRRLPPLAGARARFASGGVVALEAAFGPSGEFSFEVAADAPRRQREIELECRDATARWTMEDEHAVLLDRGVVERLPVASEPPLSREIRALLSWLAGGAPLKTDARAGAESVVLLEEVRELAGVTPDGRRSR